MRSLREKRKRHTWDNRGDALDETAHSQVLLDDDVYDILEFEEVLNLVGLPLTAPITNLICVVSVAHVKCV